LFETFTRREKWFRIELDGELNRVLKRVKVKVETRGVVGKG
jgi:hypothetical protein